VRRSGPLTAAAAKEGVTFRAITRLGCGMTTGVALTDEGDVISWSPGCAADTSDYIQRSLADAQPRAVKPIGPGLVCRDCVDHAEPAILMPVPVNRDLASHFHFFDHRFDEADQNRC